MLTQRTNSNLKKVLATPIPATLLAGSFFGSICLIFFGLFTKAVYEKYAPCNYLSDSALKWDQKERCRPQKDIALRKESKKLNPQELVNDYYMNEARYAYKWRSWNQFLGATGNVYGKVYSDRFKFKLPQKVQLINGDWVDLIVECSFQGNHNHAENIIGLTLLSEGDMVTATFTHSQKVPHPTGLKAPQPQLTLKAENCSIS